MSLYENLPVYKKALDLTVYFNTIVIHFNKHYKYTIGADLCNLSRKILIIIARANLKEDRKLKLIEAIEFLEELKILLHICKEVKAFNGKKSFGVAVKSVIEVLKQCEGWLRSQNSSSTKP
jgi:hypothetical protein